VPAQKRHAAHVKASGRRRPFDLTAPTRSRWLSNRAGNRIRDRSLPRLSVPSTGPHRSSGKDYIRLSAGTKSVNRTLEANPGAGRIKGLNRQPGGQPATFVIDAYRQLQRIENAFRMSSSDLQAHSDLSPHPRFHRSPPQRRLRHDGGGITPDRAPNRLTHSEIGWHRTPLLHRDRPSRQPHSKRRRPHHRTLEILTQIHGLRVH
jgi:hypothetical protein